MREVSPVKKSYLTVAFRKTAKGFPEQAEMLNDILFFDWVLLCHSNFFPRFYPELKGVVGPHMFGYNKKQHALHFVAYIPACAVAAWLFTRLF